jgi:hypothetical protein
MSTRKNIQWIWQQNTKHQTKVVLQLPQFIHLLLTEEILGFYETQSSLKIKNE